ncbi:hypothetical protein RhiJN_02716 [Ceratobasidium sp. AG-Ba]|nr:hypothetical protein RhiJN_02716 [Ceratobasidium sp. AG-Ba]
MSPLTNSSIVANFPSLVLQSLSRPHAGIVANPGSESASIAPSRALSRGDTLPMIEDVPELPNGDPSPPTDLEAPNEAAPVTTRTPIQTPYLAWEDTTIIKNWTGPESSIERVEKSLAAGMTPRDEDRLDEEWKKLATGPFNGRRTPLALARRWTFLVQSYLTIRAIGSPTESDTDDSGPAIAARALAQAQSVQPQNKVIRNMKASNVVRWCSGENGWFETMHTQLRYFKAPAPGSKDTWPPTLCSMATQPRSMPSIFATGGVSHQMFASTPPPPSSTSQGHSAIGSGPSSVQPAHMPHGAPGALHPPGSQQGAPAGMASTWEMARDSHAVAESQMGVLASKEEYLNGGAMFFYISVMKKLMEMHLEYTESRSNQLLKLLQVPIPEIRQEVIAMLRQLHLADPAMIDYGSLLNNLELEMKRRGMLPTEED